MRRVVVTGMGIWSCIGQDLKTVTESLKQGKSGIIFDPKRIEYGLQSGLVGNVPRPNLKPLLPRKFRATMSEDAEYAYMAARQAFKQAGISDIYLRQHEVGVIWGHDYVTTSKIECMQIIENERDSRMIAPGMLFKNETSSISINLSSIFHLRGVNLSVGAACACGLQAIALGSLYIQRGLQDTILVGGASEINLLEAACSEAIGDISKQNNSPQTNPKPFHINRDGIVHSGGGAALILEDYEHAVARKAIPLFEVKGYGFSTQSFNISDDFSHMHTMRNALKNAQLEPSSIDYVNSAASGGIKYDLYETTALRSIFSSRKTLIGSTECLTGHAHHMSGVSKTIYTALMMLNHFVAPNTNIKMKTDLMPETHTLNIPTQRIESPIHNAMINGTGLAGMSCSIIIGKL